MLVKLKKCKGTGVAIGFGCGEENLVRTYGLGHGCRCYQTWLVTSDAGKEKLKRATLKVTAPRLELEKAGQERKDRKSLSYLLTNTKNVAHEYVRKRDYKKPCISCGNPWHSDFQAGHLYKAELFSTIKFNELNINGQCQRCNLFNDGNESGYRVGFINRYGKEALDELDSLAMKDKQSDCKWEREELEKIRKYYQSKIKELKLHDYT